MSNRRAHSDGQALPGRLPRKASAALGSRKSSGPSPRTQPPAAVSNRQRKLHTRLKTAEETIRAIQSGEVDALMVSGHRGEQVVTLGGGEPTYRMLVEAMSEGAATLTRDGVLLYCNRRFAEMVSQTPGDLIGVAAGSLVAENERDKFQTLLSDARKKVVKSEFNLLSQDGSLIPVHLSLNRFRGFKGNDLGMVITDLSEQKRKQADELRQAEAMQRILLEHTLVAQEEERRRIARELHDEAGQLLTALLVGLRTLEDAHSLAQVRSQGQRLREIAAQAIDEVGRLARGLHPTVLDDHGLGVALSRYAAEYAKTHKISVDLTLNENDISDLSSGARMALYRILQEALTNVARHSGASAVTIRFIRSAEAVQIAVTDDGCGFDAKAVAVSSHRLGIQSMRERAAMFGGAVSFIPQRKGTRIQVKVPLPQHDAQSPPGQRNT